MKEQQTKLSLGTRGQAVWYLKLKLSLLGFDLDGNPSSISSSPMLNVELFDKATAKAVKEFQKSQNLSTTGIVDSLTATRLDQAVEESNKFAVFGRVVDKDGKPLSNVIVVASDRDVGKSSVLNKTTTGSQGRYVIFYNRAQFSRAEKANADLLLSVTRHAEYKPDIVFNAKPIELVNLAPQGSAYKPPSEYETLLLYIEPLLGNITVPNAPQAETLEKLIWVIDQSANRSLDPKTNDLTFLRQEMSEQRQEFDALTAAIRLSASLKNKFSLALIYGLIRQNLPKEPDRLLNTLKPVIVSALASAFSANIIPTYAKEQELKFLAFLQTLSINHQTREATTKENSTLGDLLRLSGVAKKAQIQYAKAVYEYDEAPETFHNALLSDYELTTAQVDKIRFVLDLGSLASGHAPMVAAMIDLMQSSTRRLNTADQGALAKLELTEWQALIQGRDGTGYPIDTQGGNTTEKRENYAKVIKQAVEDTYPTQTIAYRLPALITADDSLQKDLVAFFDKNSAFEFEQHSVNKYFNGEANIQGIQNVLLVQQTLQQTQRLLKVVGSDHKFNAIAPLIKAGYNSASQIASTSQQAFVNSVSGSMSKTSALKVHALSSSVAISTELVKSRIRERVNPAVPAAIPPLIDPDKLPDIFTDSPYQGLADVFGALNGCACEHCQSAYSPAAYYVDLLNELNKEAERDVGVAVDGVDEEGNHSLALAELFKRRPDLEHIQLSCANSHTAIPYIDLLNEVLESAISGDAYRNQTGGTDKTQEELKARWEHQNDAVYNLINRAGLNWAPIYEPSFVEATALLDYFNIDASNCLRLFGASDGSEVIQATVELGVSNATAEMFTTPTSNNHGLSFTLTEFMQQSGLSYEAVDQLLTLTWVNPEGRIDVEFDDAHPCDIDYAKLININNKDADRIWRFLRLHAALGWPLDTLGSALAVASQWANNSRASTRSADGITFTQLASLRSLSERTGREISQVSDWFFLGLTEEALTQQTSQRLDALAQVSGNRLDSMSVVASLMGQSLLLMPERDQGQPLSPRQTIELMDVLALMSELDVDVYQLRWLLTNQDTTPASFEPTTNSITTFINNLWLGVDAVRTQLADIQKIVDGVVDVTEDKTEQIAEQMAQLNLAIDDYVVAEISTLYSATEDVVSLLFDTHFSETEYALNNWRAFLTNTAEDSDASERLSRGLRQCSKALALQKMFALSDDALVSQFYRNSGLITAVDESVDFKHWFAFAQLARLDAQRSDWGVSVFAMVETPQLDIVASISGWPREALDVFSTSPEMDIDLSEPHAYEKLIELFDLIRRFNVTPADLVSFINALNNQDYAAQSNWLNQVGRTKLGDQDWFKIITPINGVIREQKRDVLVNYLKSEMPTHVNTEFASTNELYAYFLIDPDMSSCRDTSRIKNAISSVQLYIQRIRMGLETLELSSLGATFDQEWEWRKNYRVWEANRKVFLYPENYIFPELRDDQTVLFKEYASKLLQDELTPSNIDLAITQYLEQLDEVARLTIQAIYQEEGGAPVSGGAPASGGGPFANGALHVLAKSTGDPASYFYRKRNPAGVWEGWHRVELDIRGNHQVLVENNGRLYLVWLTIDEVSDGEQIFDNEEVTPRHSSKITKLTVNISERAASGWAAFNSTIVEHDTPINADRVSLKTQVDALNKLSIAIYTGGNTRQVERVLTLNLCTNSLTVDAHTDRSKWPAIGVYVAATAPRYALKENKYYKNSGSFRYPLIDYEGRADRASLDGENPFFVNVFAIDRPFMLLPPSQRIQLSSELPFVFSDAFGTFIGQRSVHRITGASEGIEGIMRDPRGGHALNSIKREHLDTVVEFKFSPHYHPFSCQLLSKVRKGTVSAMYDGNIQQRSRFMLVTEDGTRRRSFDERYGTKKIYPNNTWGLVPHPETANEDLVYGATESYAVYNWELFFHIPLHTAQLLTQAGKYEEAQLWLHRVFNPTDKSLGSNAGFWRIAPFFNEARSAPQTIEALLAELQADNVHIKNSIDAWRADPFNPHLLARMRTSAYMRKTVIQYLDNLVQWGDYLFSRHTIESINEASHIYILAQELLGPKPTQVAKKAPENEASFADLKGLDAFSNALLEDVDIAHEVSGDAAVFGHLTDASLINVLFFCIPDNDHLLKYWDIVADRLFKIRHCQDLNGRSRTLPLFQPQIDPVLLVRARAAGLDINRVLDGLYGGNQPQHRYSFLWHKALDLCHEVRSLGAALLSALEKKDAEQLAAIRATNESHLFELQVSISDQRIEESKKQLGSLKETLKSAEKRRDTYANREYLNTEERESGIKLDESDAFEFMSSFYSNAATVAGLIPQFHAQAMASGTSTGGKQISGVFRAYAEFMATRARNLSRKSSRLLNQANYKRRQEDWDLQKELAIIDITQIGEQILASEIRISILENEKQNLHVQIEQSRQIADFLRSKFTNQSLYTWMSNQLVNVYRQTYNLAIELANQAKNAATHELGQALNGIDFRDQWDSKHKGLLAGERLALQLRRLDKEFLDKNKRKFELNKSISLSRLNPGALFAFRDFGQCEFSIPPWVFDMDFPNHGGRRIKNVRLTIPAVTGPYTTLAAELSLNGSGETIATSNGQNDAGLFELNFRDDRFLPFEGQGLDEPTSWTLRLPGQNAQFDPATISDVILHISYTASDKTEGSGPPDTTTEPMPPLFSVLSVKNQFPTQWSRLHNAEPAVLAIKKNHLPYGTDSIGLIVHHTSAAPGANPTVNFTHDLSNPWQVELTVIDIDAVRDIHLFIPSNTSAT